MTESLETSNSKRSNVFNLVAQRENSPRTKHAAKDARRGLLSWVEADSSRHLSTTSSPNKLNQTLTFHNCQYVWIMKESNLQESRKRKQLLFPTLKASFQPCHPALPHSWWIALGSTMLNQLLPWRMISSPKLWDICKILPSKEEHYVSKQNFLWPQVSCDPGYPARGIRTVLVNYSDSWGEIQKFATWFPSIYETQSFICALKEILKDGKGPKPLNIDFGLEILSQSKFMSTNKHSYRASEELSFVTPADKSDWTELHNK